MTTARLDFSALFTEPRTLVVCVTIEGDPHVYTPAGVRPTVTAVSSGTIDPAWWPSTGSIEYDLPGSISVDPVADLLDPEVVWSIYQQADPLKGDVSVEPLVFDLFDRYATLGADVSGEATQIVSARDYRLGQLLASTVTAAATSIPLASTSGVPSSGIACLGRETIIYDGVGGGALGITASPAARGCFGSAARPHRFDPTRPLVVSFGGPRFLQGRTARVWLCRYSGTTLYDPTVIFLGAVGAGVQRTRSNTRWSIPLDPATEALGRKLPRLGVSVAGLHHYDRTTYSPFASQNVALGATDAAPHDGGWHSNWRDFVAAWNVRAGDLGSSEELQLAGDRLRFDVPAPGTSIRVAFERVPTIAVTAASGTASWTSTERLPSCVAHLDGWLRLPTPGDLAKIPTTLSFDYPAVGTPSATAEYTLSAKCRGGNQVAVIKERNSTSAIPAVRLVVVSPTEVIATQQGTLITEPQQATLGVISAGSDPVSCLRAAARAIDAIFATAHSDAIDWDGIALAFAMYPVDLPGSRIYRLGDGDTLLDVLSHEARLRGMQFCVRYGKISVFRTADFASTETTTATITESDLVTDDGTEVEPEVIDGEQPVATSVIFTTADGTTYQWIDTTAQDDHGDGGEISCRALETLHPDGVLPQDALVQIQRVAQQLLGPLAIPFRIVRVTLGPPFLGLQPGDLVSLTHPRIPTYEATIGVQDAVCQVQDVRAEVFGGKGRLTASLRLQSEDIAGYAPSCFVAAGGLSTGGGQTVVTVDIVTAWGSSGFAVDGRAPTDGFQAGDYVLLREIDNETPAADESFSIASLTATTITLAGTASAGMVALAAAQYKVMLTFDEYATINARQTAFVSLADDATDTLSGGAAPKRWAA
jgi:hypothetical protein